MISKTKIQRWVRKSHRYLGLVLGIQFLAWTLGGLYFSWTSIEQIRGEDLHADKRPLPIQTKNASLGILLDSLQAANPNMSFKTIQVVDILGKAYYQIAISVDEQVLLFDVKTLRHKQPLTEQQAKNVAQQSLKSSSEILKVEYLTSTNGHHEYREKPLPAYAVTFEAPNNTTVYVSTELGTVLSYRNNAWRLFDFLWMLHTMDYENRDNINNWLLRLFSVFGLITISSGMLLFYLTTKTKLLQNE